jgi:hypothetical protein
LGRGRLQRQIARAFDIHGPVASGSVIYEWCRRWNGRDGRPWRWSIIRILLKDAERVGRAPTRGRPWLWRLRNSDTERCEKSS